MLYKFSGKKIIFLIFFVFLFLIVINLKLHNIDDSFNDFYSIVFRNKKIGYCKVRDDFKICKIFFKKNGKKFELRTEIKINKEYFKYKSPLLKLKGKIDKNTMIYPFIFKINRDKKIYYPELDEYFEVGDLKIKKINDTMIYLPPFIYKKEADISGNITLFPIEELKKVKSEKIKISYPVKFIITFESEILPPSDLRQSCKRLKNNIVCILESKKVMSKGDIEIESERNVSGRIKKFIKKYRLDDYKNIDDLITSLIEALNKEIEYFDVSLNLTADEILKYKKGDCNEFSKLAVAVLGGLGINAKRVYGLYYKRNKGIWVYHSWVEYEYNEKIYGFDPTLKRSFLTVDYLKISLEKKGLTIMPLDIEFIKIKAL